MNGEVEELYPIRGCYYALLSVDTGQCVYTKREVFVCKDINDIHSGYVTTVEVYPPKTNEHLSYCFVTDVEPKLGDMLN